MITRLVSAAARAFLVALLVVTPALLMPGSRIESIQRIVLAAFVGAAMTFVEYASPSPSFITFRAAPPYNRTRFFSLAATVLVLTLICRGETLPSPLTAVLRAFGEQVGEALDFPFSPVHLMVLAAADIADHVRPLAGMAHAFSLGTVAVFAVAVRFLDWPLHAGAFNFWVNLPLYDPTAGGDILVRLRRDGQVNLVLGFLLPFLIPAALSAVSVNAALLSMADPQTLIWMVSIWAFLPASVFMRGIALMRIAALIEEKRRRAYAQADLQTV